MKIQLSNSPYKTVIDSEHDVTITEAFSGPIFRTADGVCLSVMMRDDGYEINCWQGTAEHNGALPLDAVQLAVNPQKVTVVRAAGGVLVGGNAS